MAYCFINMKKEVEMICLQHAQHKWLVICSNGPHACLSLIYSIHSTARCPEWSPVWWVGLHFYTRALWPHVGQTCPRPTAVTPAPLSTHHATPPETCTPLWPHAGTLNMSMRNIFQDLPILMGRPQLGGQNDCTPLRDRCLRVESWTDKTAVAHI